jgi:nucleotide-binding universal stress UspA family protein
VSYKDILVFLDDGKSNEVRVNVAIYLAKAHDAKLTGVSLESMRPEHLRVKDEDSAAALSKQYAHDIAKQFADSASNAGVKDADTIVISGRFSESARKMSRYARNYDLVMLRQPNPDKENYGQLKEFAEDVMMHCGRPVFFMPYIGAHRIPCKKVMIAWDGTPSATRAVHNAIPLISKSQEVTILAVASKKVSKEEMLLDELAAHLKRHGIDAKAKYLEPGAFDIQTTILNELADNDIDILVMGGYGTPSLRQKIFGGVTHTILSSMIVPILMSH